MTATNQTAVQVIYLRKSESLWSAKRRGESMAGRRGLIVIR